MFNLKRFQLDGLFGVYSDVFLLYLAMGLVSIFIPLYVLKITGRLTDIFLLYGLFDLTVLIFLYPAALLVSKFGVDLTSFLSSFLRIAFLSCLILAAKSPFFLSLAFFFWGAAIPFCWLPFYYTLIRVEDGDGLFGKEVSQIDIFSRIASALAPFIGGLLISFFGFSYLYFVAIILLFFQGATLYLDKFERKGMRLDLEKITTTFVEKRLRKTWASVAGQTLSSGIYDVVWPIFTFLAVGSYKVLGAIQSGALMISLIVAFWVGKFIDQKGKSILKLGAVMNSFNWLIRTFLKAALSIFLVDTLYQITALLVNIPLEAEVYEESKTFHKLEFLLQREVVVHATAFFLDLLLFFLFYLQVSWFLIFSLGAAGLMMTMVIVKNQTKPNG